MRACHARCWSCKFDMHDDVRHTWLDADDLADMGIPYPSSRAEWDHLAITDPCLCWCQERVSHERGG